MKSLMLEKWATVIRWHDLPGTGLPIVCLPGLSFAAVPNFLALLMQPGLRGRRALMIDYVGSGFSGRSDSFGYGLADHAETVAAVLDAAGTGAACLLGHSMGGSVAVQLAFDRPDLVARLVVCEGNLTPGGGVATRRFSALAEAAFVETGFARFAAGWHEAAMRGDALMDFISGARSGADPRGLHANSRALVNLPADFLDRFLALAVERHFVWGERTFPGNTGEITPDAPDPEPLRAGGVGIHVVPGVGHDLMLGDPAAFATALSGVL